MVSNRTRGVYLICVYGHLLLSQACFWLWAGMFNLMGIIKLLGPDTPAHFLYSEILSIGVVLGATFVRERNELIGSVVDGSNGVALRQIVTAYCLLFFYLIASKDTGISRLFVFTMVVPLYLTLHFANCRLPALVRRQMFQGDREERILVAGGMEGWNWLSDWLRRKELVGYRTVGQVCDDATDCGSGQILGRLGDLERVIAAHQVTQLIVSEAAIPTGFLAGAAEVCERLGVRLLVVNDMDRHFNHPVTLVEDDGMRFLTLRVEPLESPFNRILKRTLDIVIAAPVTVFLLPCSHLLVWLLQCWQSPGPVYFKQTRAGIRNRPFIIYKFRTMHVNSGDESRQATMNDTRIFPAGRWLRKLSIDELPQFYNVLRGDMSVVGPRPHLIQHNDLFAQAMKNYHVRAIAKPGITGLAQVCGFRGEATTPQEIIARVGADVKYLETWTFLGDCLIVLRTLLHVIAPPRKAV